MEVLQQIGVNVLLPIITLTIGFLLGYGKDYLDRKRRVNNMKLILFKELSDNYDRTLFIIDEAKIGVDIADKNHMIVAAIMTTYTMEFLSVTILDTYLDRLDTLKPREVAAIYDAYSAIKFAMKSRNELVSKGEATQNQKEAAAGAHLYYIKEMYEKTRNALILFKDGKEFVETRQPADETLKLLMELTSRSSN